MKQELLDLIHLNTYIDYSANKASDSDISELLSKCGMILPDDYLNFLRELNGFKLYKNLALYGTREQPKIPVFDALRSNEMYRSDYPALTEYFLIGSGFEEFFAYSSADKKYYTLWFSDNEEVMRGHVFEDFDSLIDWAVRLNAKRKNEEKPIINKEALLHITGRITDFLASHNFKMTRGDVILDDGYSYERPIAQGIEFVSVSIQVSLERDRMRVAMGTWKRYNLIEDFFDPEDHKRAPGTHAGPANIILSTEYPGGAWEFSEQKVNDDPEALASHFISFIDTHIFTALSLYDNVQALDARVNKPLDSMGNIGGRFHFGHYKMVIARLAGNPLYDELFKSMKEKFENAVQKVPDNEKYRGYLEVTLKLHDKLQKVSPLKDGMLV